MVERRHGWEGASPALLARVFSVSVEQSADIVQETCAMCGRAICGCRDDQWSGSTNSRPSLSTGDRDGAGNARAASDVNAVTEREAMTAAKPGNVAISQVLA